MDDLRKEFEEEVPAENRDDLLTTRGGESGRLKMPKNRPHDICEAFRSIRRQLTDIECPYAYGLQLLSLGLEVCAENDVTPERLVEVWRGYDREMIDIRLELDEINSHLRNR